MSQKELQQQGWARLRAMIYACKLCTEVLEQLLKEPCLRRTNNRTKPKILPHPFQLSNRMEQQTPLCWLTEAVPGEGINYTWILPEASTTLERPLPSRVYKCQDILCSASCCWIPYPSLPWCEWPGNSRTWSTSEHLPLNMEKSLLHKMYF